MKLQTLSAASLLWGLLFMNIAFGAMVQQSRPQASEKPVQVNVDEQGFHPASLSLKAQVPAKITFLRTTDKTCATAVAIPDYNIKKELPLNKPVELELTPQKTGEITFVCGLNMFKGKLVVTDK
jgi:plastocyanin domain-containing protein